MSETLHYIFGEMKYQRLFNRRAMLLGVVFGALAVKAYCKQERRISALEQEVKNLKSKDVGF